MTDYDRELRDFRYLGVIGRIRSGWEVEGAEAELDLISRRVAAENPATNAGWTADVRSLKEYQVGGVVPLLLGISAAVALLLIIAIGNVANIAVARTVGRRTENALKRALGAGSGALVRTHFAEFALLALVGSAIGVVAASLGFRALVAADLLFMPRAGASAVDLRDAVFALDWRWW